MPFVRIREIGARGFRVLGLCAREATGLVRQQRGLRRVLAASATALGLVALGMFVPPLFALSGGLAVGLAVACVGARRMRVLDEQLARRMQQSASDDLAENGSVTWIPRTYALIHGVSEAQRRQRHLLAETLDEMRANADEIGAASGSLSGTSMVQAVSVEESRGVIDQIVAQIDHEHALVERAAGLSKDSVESIGSVQGDMGQLVEAMGGIHTSSREIADLLGVVDEIAFQTNLLALNAAVEAARAGEAGRGFAIVADEVRALAQRSKSSAQTISEQASAALRRATEGNQIVERAGKSLDRLIQGTVDVGDALREIAEGANQQRESIGLVTNAIAQLDASSQSNAVSGEELGASTEKLNQYLVQLQGLTVDEASQGGQEAAVAANGESPSDASASVAAES